MIMNKVYYLLLFFLAFGIPLFSEAQVKKTKQELFDEILIDGEVIVRLQEGWDPEAVIRELPQNFETKVNRLLSKPTDIWLFDFNEENTSVFEVLDAIIKVEGVKTAQVNTAVELRQAPNDPSYGSQWQHQNIDSELAWDITTGGTNADNEDIVVCIIESADVMGHPDLQDNHWVNTNEIPGNGVDDDGNGYVDDYNGWNVGNNTDNIGAGGHGTAVAGMIGAKGDNGLGVSGANWDVKMMVVAGYGNPFTQANIVEAYTYPMEHRILYNQTNGADGAFVVSTNASWGVDGGDPADYPIWCDFYDDLGQVGILNCGATTNNNWDVDQTGDVPTACASSYMVSVTATDANDIIDFAGYGQTTINVAAPGSSIYSTSSNGNYSSTSGTSFASPLTAGVIGLMYSIPCPSFMNFVKSNPQAAADAVRDALYDGVDQSTHLMTRTTSGGRINAKTSIDLLMAQLCSSCQPPSNITVDNAGDNDITISYDGIADADDYTIYIQEQGTGNWTSTTTSNLTHVFNGLNSCRTYEIYIESNCGSDVSSASPITTVNTTGCGNCIELAYCEPTVTNPGLAFDIHAPASQAGAVIDYEETNGWGKPINEDYIYGNLVIVDDGTAAFDEGCNPLVNAGAMNGNIAIAMRGSCTFVDKALNAQNAGATGLIIVNNEPGLLVMGGTTQDVDIPVVMITETQGNALIAEINAGEDVTVLLGEQNEFIESFELDDNLNVSGDNGGYLAPGLAEIDLNINQSYNFTMTPGFDGQPLDEYTRIWIDLNQDGLYTTNEIVYDQGTTSNGVLTDAFTVPGTADLGSTRLRVQMAYQGYGSDPLVGGCDDFTSGEVEDYCVNIKSGVFCNLDVTPTMTDPACNSVQDGVIELAVTGGTPGYNYSWSNGAGNVTTASGLNAGTYNITISDASGCDTTVSYNLNYSTVLDMTGNVTNPSCNQIQNGEITVTATGGNGITYQWNGGTSGQTLSNLDAGTYSVTATADNGCTISDNFTLSYTTNITVNETIIQPTCIDSEDGSITVSASGSSGLSYQWNSGPTSATWSGLNDGTYEVTVTDTDGCSHSETYVLEATPSSPTASFTAAPNYLDVELFNTSTNGNSYSWDFGDDNTSNTFNTSHTYAADGTYNVCLTVVGDCEEVTTCNEVTVSQDVANLTENNIEDFILVYPNPASNQLNFKIQTERAASIEIIDATGKLVGSYSVEEQLTTVNVHQFVNGLYIYNVKDNNGNSIKTDKISIVR